MASNRPLPGDITVTGSDQASLYAWMANVTDLLNEIQADHATTKTTVDALVTLATELRVDHATNKTAVDELNTLTTELRTDHATFITLTDELKTDVNAAVVDLGAIRTKFVALTAKLDLDGGVTDTNYAATLDPAALTATSIAAASVATITAPAATAGYATITAAAPAAGPATLANATALTLLRS